MVLPPRPDAVHALRAVRSRAKAQIFPVVPVVQVVAAGKAGAREVGDLVARKAVRGEIGHAGVLHVGHGVLVRQGRAPGAHPLKQRRALLEDERVGGHMPHIRPRAHARERVQVCRRALPGQAVHHVHIDVVKPGVPRKGHGPFKLFVGMDAADGGQQRAVGALQSDGQPVDPRRAIGGKARRIHRAGVALHGDLRIRHHGIARAQRVEHARERPARQERRRAAAKEHRLHRRRHGQPLGSEGDLPLEQRGISFRALRLRIGNKIAVGALSDAERDVKIDAGHQLMRSTLMNASLGTCTVPTWRMRFLPSFCFSSSFFLRVISPP